MRCPVWWLPTGAEFVVIQTDPSPRLSFIMPPNTQQIRRFCGRNQSGVMRKHDLDIPAMLYSFESHSAYTMKMHVIESAGEGKLMARPMRMSNVHPNGEVCWGGERPIDPRAAIYAYWTSNFNDDLTPYPMVNDGGTAYRATPEYRQQFPQHEMYDRYFSRYGMYNTEDARIEFRRRFSALKEERKMELIERHMHRLGREIHLNEPMNGNSPHMVGSHAWFIARRDATLPPEQLSMLAGDIARSRNIFDNKIKAYRRYSDLYERVHAAQAGFDNDSYRLWGAIHDWISYVALDRIMQMGYDPEGYGSRDAIKIYIQERFIKAENYYLARLEPHIAEPKRKIARAIMRNAMKGVLRHQIYLKLNMAFSRLLDTWIQVNKKDHYSEWWDKGGWKKHGDCLDLFRFITGKEYTVEEHTPDAVLLLDRDECTRRIFGVPNAPECLVAKAVIADLDKKRKQQIMVPVWRHPENDRAVIGAYNGMPFIAQLVGAVAMLEDYNEERKRLDEKAKEVFG